MSYSQASDELERIIAALEDNSLELEESLQQYQRGVALLANLRSRLQDARQEIHDLMGGFEATDEEAHDINLS